MARPTLDDRMLCELMLKLSYCNNGIICGSLIFVVFWVSAKAVIEHEAITQT
jgi:hypothetical protein